MDPRAILRSCSLIDPLDAFVLSLGEDAPPAWATTPMLRAVWLGLRRRRGNCDTAHDLAQGQDDAEGAWVHAWLHRIEGDLGNADYLYRRAGRWSPQNDTRDEGFELRGC